MSYELSLAPPEDWNQLVASLPGAHILQTQEWGVVKSRYGWRPLHYFWRGESGQSVAAALVLQRAVPFPGLSARLRVLYIPKGPLLDWRNRALRRQVLLDLASLARQQRAIFVKVDPDVLLGTGVPGEPEARAYQDGEALEAELEEGGWRFSDEQIQFRNTVLIDLSPELETLMANMKQKTRYNIRLAGRRGLTVRVGGEADLSALYRMYAETALRDGFVIREEGYYRTVWTTFMRCERAEPLIAEFQGQIVAGVIIFYFADRAWYLYGMSSREHHEKMPNYLLQWEAIRRAKARGCRIYDLWGAPDQFEESDPLWGVYRFKCGLGGAVVRHIGAWDLPVRPWIYRLYTQALPRILDIMRRRGARSTQQSIT
jgi:lipid II:glycine glycyltransferase (peptidoglycan interpeptide bridge formation enzyme)